MACLEDASRTINHGQPLSDRQEEINRAKLWCIMTAQAMTREAK